MMASAATAGADSGITIRQKIVHSRAPSTRAASSRSSGIASMNWRIRNTPSGPAAAGRMTA